MLPHRVVAPSPWVIDSGASPHMTSTSSIMSHISPASRPSCVTLADGSNSHVTDSGTASLCSSFSLPFVLHVPKGPLNLLFISKLTQSLNYLVTFSPPYCIFQNFQTE